MCVADVFFHSLSPDLNIYCRSFYVCITSHMRRLVLLTSSDFLTQKISIALRVKVFSLIFMLLNTVHY